MVYKNINLTGAELIVEIFLIYIYNQFWLSLVTLFSFRCAIRKIKSCCICPTYFEIDYEFIPWHTENQFYLNLVNLFSRYCRHKRKKKSVTSLAYPFLISVELSCSKTENINFMYTLLLYFAIWNVIGAMERGVDFFLSDFNLKYHCRKR